MAKRRRNTLPPSPLARRKLDIFDLKKPDQGRGVVRYLQERVRRLDEDRRRYGDELDRALADVESWAGWVCSEAGLAPHQGANADDYPGVVWYSAEVRERIVELRRLREHDPQDAIVRALYLGELIGEARAQLTHGRDAARGLHLANSARKGHEQVHGDEEAKRRRWRQQVEAYQKHRRAGHPRTVAVQLAAQQLNVSERSIYNSRARLK